MCTDDMRTAHLGQPDPQVLHDSSPGSSSAWSREDLLGTVLAEATVRTFRKAAAGAGGKGGVHHVLDVLERFMRAVIAAAPLQALSKQEPLLLVRVA